MNPELVEKLKLQLEPVVKQLLHSLIDAAIVPAIERLVAQSPNKIDDLLLAALESSVKSALHDAVESLKL